MNISNGKYTGNTHYDPYSKVKSILSISLILLWKQLVFITLVNCTVTTNNVPINDL